jgi:hypothetical protein
MIRYLLLAICAFGPQINAHANVWPQSSTNTYEVIGCADLGILIPVADYRFKTEVPSSDLLVSLNVYEHVRDSGKRFTFIVDPLDDGYDVSTFAMWCLHNGNFMKMSDFFEKAKMKWTEELLVGTNGDIPAIRLVTEYEGSIVDQLFLVSGNYGCSILASYPKREEGNQSIYWNSFFNNTLPYITQINGKD